MGNLISPSPPPAFLMILFSLQAWTWWWAATATPSCTTAWAHPRTSPLTPPDTHDTPSYSYPYGIQTTYNASKTVPYVQAYYASRYAAHSCQWDLCTASCSYIPVRPSQSALGTRA